MLRYEGCEKDVKRIRKCEKTGQWLCESCLAPRRKPPDQEPPPLPHPPRAKTPGIKAPDGAGGAARRAGALDVPISSADNERSEIRSSPTFGTYAGQ